MALVRVAALDAVLVRMLLFAAAHAFREVRTRDKGVDALVSNETVTRVRRKDGSAAPCTLEPDAKEAPSKQRWS